MEQSKSLQRWLENPGWRGKVGFIAPPGFSIVPMEFLRIAPEGFAFMQTMTHIPNFKVRASQIAEAVLQLEGCAVILRDAGMDIIAQTGTPLSFAREGGLKYARELQMTIEKSTGLPVVFMGLAVLDALESMSYESVAVACTYYGAELVESYERFLQEAGFKVEAMENWVAQGIFASQDEVLIARGWYPLGHVYKAAQIVAKHAPKADCIVLSGGAVYTMDLLKELEQDLGKPVISDTAAHFREIFVRLGVKPSIKGRGSLLASLG